MSKKSKTKIEASPSPQSPSREEEPARPNGPAAPQSDAPPADRGWGWLRTSDVEPAGAAKWDESGVWDETRWAP